MQNMNPLPRSFKQPVEKGWSKETPMFLPPFGYQIIETVDPPPKLNFSKNPKLGEDKG